MVVGGLDVRVEAHRSGADVESGDLAQAGQLAEGLVHGLERQRRLALAGDFEHRLGRRVRGVAVEDVEDDRALRRHLQPVAAEAFAELRRRSHGAKPNRHSLVINNRCWLVRRS